MPDESIERHDRIGDVHRIDIRLSLLEAQHLELSKSSEVHDENIEKLLIEITKISGKFDALLGQFSFGFKIISICAIVVTSSVGAFWVFTHDLDNKYSPKLEQIVSNTEIQKQTTISNSAKLNEVNNKNKEQSQTIQEQIAKLEKLKQDLIDMQSLKVIQASKKGKKK